MKQKLKGNLGTKSYRHQIIINNGQSVRKGSIIIISNSGRLKSGKNTYRRKTKIHANKDGIVKIKKGIANVE